jgi:hypothetical protein
MSNNYSEDWNVFIHKNGDIEIQEILHGYDGDIEFLDSVLDGNIRESITDIINKFKEFILKKLYELR